MSMPASNGGNRYAARVWLALACSSGSIELADDESVARALPADTSVEHLPGDSSGTPDDPPDGDLFAPGTLWALSLEIGESSWDDLERDGREYVDATLIAEGASWPVQIHIKGSSTWQPIDQKPSLVVDVDNRAPGAEFMDQEKFYLHNDLYDPSFMSETLAYGFYREWGYPASRTSFARLTINGDDYGLYTIVEPHEEQFLRTWFADPDGNLYENGEAYCDVWDVDCMEAEEVDEGNGDALRQLGDAARHGDFATDVWPLLDQERFVAYLALEASIAHWDSYSYDLSNYQLYHEPTTNTWSMLTQSMDLDFGWRPWSYDECARYGMDPGTYTMGALADQCQQDATCHTAFVDAVEEYADRLEAADGATRVRELDTFIGEEAGSDPRRYYGDKDYAEHISCLQGFFEDRPQQLRDWVTTQR